MGLGLWYLMPLSTIFILVLLVEETILPRENQRSVASHWQTLSHNDVVSSTSRREQIVRKTYKENKLILVMYFLIQCISNFNMVLPFVFIPYNFNCNIINKRIENWDVAVMKNILLILESRPIRTMYLVFIIFKFNNFGVGVRNSYSNKVWT
jgi:hypothetical protein